MGDTTVKRGGAGLESVMAQLAVTDTNQHDLYTVADKNGRAFGSIQVANRAGSDITVNVAVALDGGVDNAKHAWTFGKTVTNGDDAEIPLRFRLDSGGKIRVKASGNATFTLLGPQK